MNGPRADAPRPPVRRKERLAYAGLLAVVTPLGFATKLYDGPGAAWVAGSSGGFLYVLFWTFLFLACRPAWRPRRVAAGVLGVTCALEVLQLWHPPFLEAVRSRFLGHALIGSTFSVADFGYYLLAALVAPGLARVAQRLVLARETVR